MSKLSILQEAFKTCFEWAIDNKDEYIINSNSFDRCIGKSLVLNEIMFNLQINGQSVFIYKPKLHQSYYATGFIIDIKGLRGKRPDVVIIDEILESDTEEIRNYCKLMNVPVIGFVRR